MGKMQTARLVVALVVLTLVTVCQAVGDYGKDCKADSECIKSDFNLVCRTKPGREYSDKRCQCKHRWKFRGGLCRPPKDGEGTGSGKDDKKEEVNWVAIIMPAVFASLLTVVVSICCCYCIISGNKELERELKEFDKPTAAKYEIDSASADVELGNGYSRPSSARPVTGRPGTTRRPPTSRPPTRRPSRAPTASQSGGSHGGAQRPTTAHKVGTKRGVKSAGSAVPRHPADEIKPYSREDDDDDSTSSSDYEHYEMDELGSSVSVRTEDEGPATPPLRLTVPDSRTASSVNLRGDPARHALHPLNGMMQPTGRPVTAGYRANMRVLFDHTRRPSSATSLRAREEFYGVMKSRPSSAISRFALPPSPRNVHSVCH